MKKLYTLALCGAVALGASAEITTYRQLEIQPTATQVLKKISNARPGSRASVEKLNGKHNAPAKAEELSDNWTSLGTGKMQECFFSDQNQYGLGANLGIEPQVLEVTVEQNADNANVYRIVEPFKNLGVADFAYDAAKAEPMVIHLSEDGTQFYFDNFNTGVSYGESYFYVCCDASGYFPDFSFAEVNAVIQDAFGVFNGEKFTYPYAYSTGEGAYYNLSVIWGDPNTPEDAEVQPEYFNANTDGSFKILLPGAKDYSGAVVVDDCAADNKFVAVWQFSEDVAQVRAGLFNGAFPINDDILGQVATILTEEDNMPNEGGVNINLSSQPTYGEFTFIAIGLDAEGKLVCGAGGVLYVVPNRDEEFEEMGIGKYQDDFFRSLYGYESAEYDVVVEKHKTIDGYYRIKDAYGPNFEYYYGCIHPDDHSHYIYLNATESNLIYIETSVTGFDIGEGVINVSSMIAANTKLTAIQKRQYSGKYDEATRTFTFPAKSLLATPSSEAGTGYYYANNNSAFKLVLPEQNGINDIIADDDANAPAEYFNLQGQRVINPAAGQLVIKRQGGKASKVLAK